MNARAGWGVLAIVACAAVVALWWQRERARPQALDAARAAERTQEAAGEAVRAAETAPPVASEAEVAEVRSEHPAAALQERVASAETTLGGGLAAWRSGPVATGRLEDEYGEPIAGATVELYESLAREGAGPVVWARARVVTADDGAFELRDVVGAGELELRATASGFGPARRAIQDGTAVGTWRLRRLDGVSARLLFDPHIPTGRLEVVAIGRPYGERATTPIDGDGRFDLVPPRSGPFDVYLAGWRWVGDHLPLWRAADVELALAGDRDLGEWDLIGRVGVTHLTLTDIALRDRLRLMPQTALVAPSAEARGPRTTFSLPPVADAHALVHRIEGEAVVLSAKRRLDEHVELLGKPIAVTLDPAPLIEVRVTNWDPDRDPEELELHVVHALEGSEYRGFSQQMTNRVAFISPSNAGPLMFALTEVGGDPIDLLRSKLGTTIDVRAGRETVVVDVPWSR